MFRDPLYRQIRRRLRELKDGNTFEQCANDLLSKIYPSLAPREGGDDAGLDGLIANQDKSSIQLICTTGEDVLGNLSGSIESNLKKGGKSYASIFATSQSLSNPKKRILEERANKLGRTLIQIYDQVGASLDVDDAAGEINQNWREGRAPFPEDRFSDGGSGGAAGVVPNHSDRH